MADMTTQSGEEIEMLYDATGFGLRNLQNAMNSAKEIMNDRHAAPMVTLKARCLVLGASSQGIL